VQGEPGEDWLPLARDLHPMLHVSPRLLLGERPEVIARGHALGELPKVAPGQELGQLGLTDQNDLKELFLRRLQIRQEANLLQHAGAQILSLVDDQHRPPAARVSVEQSLGQRVDQDFEARGPRRVRDPQLVAYRGEQLDRGEPGIEDHRDVDVRGQLFQQGAADRGLSRAHLARELHEVAALAEPVEQVGESLAVSVAQIEVARIRRQGKRPLGEPEICCVHKCSQ